MPTQVDAGNGETELRDSDPSTCGAFGAFGAFQAFSTRACGFSPARPEQSQLATVAVFAPVLAQQTEFRALAMDITPSEQEEHRVETGSHLEFRESFWMNVFF